MDESFDFKEAGLPNITGLLIGGTGSTTGNFRLGEDCFYLDSACIYTTVGQTTGDGKKSAFQNAYFDASRCSPVYRNDITTVQPASYTVCYIIKVKK